MLINGKDHKLCTSLLILIKDSLLFIKHKHFTIGTLLSAAHCRCHCSCIPVF